MPRRGRRAYRAALRRARGERNHGCFSREPRSVVTREDFAATRGDSWSARARALVRRAAAEAESCRGTNGSQDTTCTKGLGRCRGNRHDCTPPLRSSTLHARRPRLVDDSERVELTDCPCQCSRVAPPRVARTHPAPPNHDRIRHLPNRRTTRHVTGTTSQHEVRHSTIRVPTRCPSASPRSAHHIANRQNRSQNESALIFDAISLAIPRHHWRRISSPDVHTPIRRLT